MQKPPVLRAEIKGLDRNPQVASRERSTTAPAGFPIRTFGTFAGVFTPTLLAILGVIMYLRLGWVVGNAGLIGALLIIALAVTITACTGLSISSVATNTRLEAGGPFAVIYRALGREAGGSIGLPLFVSQALAVAMYIFGFREGWMWVFPEHSALAVDVLSFAVVFGIAYISASFAFRIQYVILTIIALSLVSIFGSHAELQAVNQVKLWGEFSGASFWVVFAVFFPATTGILVGSNMSGELTNPRRSIPIGTLLAILISTVIYVALAFWAARAATPDVLISNYNIMIDKALWGPLVLLGLLGATFSSALSSQVGAPRILQAMGSKKLIPFSSWFEKTASNGEPRNAMLATSAVVLAGLLMRDLNTIAMLITMFFLITYFALNLIVLIESNLGLISFRPTLRVPRIVPVVGAAGCVFAMFTINATFSIIASVVVIALYIVLVGRSVEGEENDTRSSVFEAIAAWAFVRLSVFDRDNPRTWKPNLLVPVEAPEELNRHAQLLLDLCRPEGSVKLIGLATETRAEGLAPRIAMLGAAFRSRKLFTTWSTIDAPDYFHGVVTGLQALQSAFFRPNVVFLQTPDVIEREADCLGIIAEARRAGIGVLLVAEHPKAGYGSCSTINLWVRPAESYDLKENLNRGAMHLAILFTIHVARAWKAKLNLVSVVANEEEEKLARTYLEQIIEHCRLPSPVSCVIMQGSLKECVARAPESDLDVMGLATTPDLNFIRRMVEDGKSSHVFVLDSGREDALA